MIRAAIAAILALALAACATTGDGAAAHPEARAYSVTADATADVDAALARVKSEWPRLVHSYPRWEQYREPAQQIAYDEALGTDKYPRFDPLQLRLRLPVTINSLRREVIMNLKSITN